MRSTRLLLAFFFLLAPVRAQEPEADTPPSPAVAADAVLERELAFVEGLLQLGLADYADIVLKSLGTDPKVGVMKLRTFLIKGEFPKVIALIAKEPNQDGENVWAMKLALADGYYAWGKYKEARALYDGFFKKYAGASAAGTNAVAAAGSTSVPESLKEFFASSGYKYAQMLIVMKDDKAAVQALRTTLSVKLDRQIERQLQCELGDLLIKVGSADPAARDAAFAEVDSISQKILWVQDEWFGKAIVMMAHMRLLKGELEGATKLLEDYADQLKQIDDFLQEESKATGRDMTRQSPVAECRYLIGCIMQQEAERKIKENKPHAEILELLVGKKAARGTNAADVPGALQHFVNVFYRYSSSSWAPDAGVHLREVEALLKQIGVDPPVINISDEQRLKVEKMLMLAAKAEFNNGQYAEAVEQYRKFLSLFPEVQSSVPALTDLAVCYMELGDDIFADTVAHHVADQFGRRKDELMSMAGDSILLIASAYEERKKSDKASEMEDLFAARFPNHPRTAGFIFRRGEKRFEGKDYAGAMVHYAKILEGFTNSPICLDAMNRMAACYRETNRREEEVKLLTQVSALLDAKPVPGPALIACKYRLAVAYRDMGPKFLPSAFNRYAEIIKSLSGPDAKRYQRTQEEADANGKLLEGALYGSASLYTRMTPPAGRPADEYKLAAIKGFDSFVAKFPESSNAPGALMQLGAIWTLLDKPDEAQKAMSRLQKDYPESQEAKNARFMFARLLLNMGRRAQAIAEIKKMFGEEGGKYPASQILMAANELQKENENELAVEAYDSLVATNKTRSVLEPALVGRGRALLALQKYPESAASFEKLLSTFTNTGFTVEACMGLSQAYGEMGSKEPEEKKRLDLFNNAVKAMNRASSFERSSEVQSRAELIKARISELKAKASEQFGPKERVGEYRGKAVATYQILMNMRDPNDMAARPNIEQAFGECVPLMQSMGRWQDVLDDAVRYLELFKGGKFETQARSWMNEAKAKIATQAPVAPAPGEAQP